MRFFFPPVSTLERPRFVGVPGKLPSILQSIRESYWNKRKPIWRISQSFHDQHSLLSEMQRTWQLASLRILVLNWPAPFSLRDSSPRHPVGHCGSVLPNCWKLARLIQEPCPCSKSYNYIVLYTSYYTDYWLLYLNLCIYIYDYHWLHVSYIIFDYWLLYLNQPHFFTKNPPTIINHPKHRHGTGRGTREPPRKSWLSTGAFSRVLWMAGCDVPSCEV